MRKSHHAAKAATHDHTQHGGTQDRTSVIVQQYEWWYHCIQHRYTIMEKQREEGALRGSPNLEAIAATAKRREVWHASSVAAKHEEWQRGRKQEGNRWVAPDVIHSTTQDGAEFDVQTSNTSGQSSEDVTGLSNSQGEPDAMSQVWDSVDDYITYIT